MKTLLFGSLLIFMAASCSNCKNGSTDGSNNALAGKKAKAGVISSMYSKRPLPTSGYTLDGLTIQEADAMITAFANDNTNTNKQTSIWLSSKWVSNIGTLLDKENQSEHKGVDGIRIYFAKNSDGKNTLVFVPTTELVMLSTTNDTAKYHVDYFNHVDQSFLQAAKSEKNEEYGNDPGAMLYQNGFRCPPPSTKTCNSAIALDHLLSCSEAYAEVGAFFNIKLINTSSVWFAKEVFDALNDELKQQAMADGIRIYFASNGKKRTTLIIKTTKTDNNGAHRVDNFECFSAPSTQKLNDATNDPYNHGEECPTICDIVTWPEN